jgi:hypothetical protein
MPAPPWFERRQASEMMHSGPIASAVPGRTDLHNMSVKSGSYVLPAETISHLGQSNSIAGLHIAGKMFGNSGPFGAGTLAIRHASGMPRLAGAPKAMTNFASGGYSEGGLRGDSSAPKVPIVAAGGEFVIDPEVVRNIGNGSIEAGHKILDRFVMSKRQEHIKTLKHLAPPAKK